MKSKHIQNLVEINNLIGIKKDIEYSFLSKRWHILDEITLKFKRF